MSDPLPVALVADPPLAVVIGRLIGIVLVLIDHHVITASELRDCDHDHDRAHSQDHEVGVEVASETGNIKKIDIDRDQGKKRKRNEVDPHQAIHLRPRHPHPLILTPILLRITRRSVVNRAKSVRSVLIALLHHLGLAPVPARR